GSVEGETEIGISLIAKARAKLSGSASKSTTDQFEDPRQTVNDLDFVCQVLIEACRRLVIEDFHYLAVQDRKRFAFDMKAMWDRGLYVIVVGVWSDANLLLHLTPDLTGRIREISVTWSSRDLRTILQRGAKALNLRISNEVQAKM